MIPIVIAFSHSLFGKEGTFMNHINQIINRTQISNEFSNLFKLNTYHNSYPCDIFVHDLQDSLPLYFCSNT